MKHVKSVLLFGIVLLAFSLPTGFMPGVAQNMSEMVEPEAGSWPTWLLDAGDQLRLDAPPDDAATADEIADLKAMVSARDENALQQIAYWNAGPPSYRWNQITAGAIGKRAIPGPGGIRVLALVQASVYDATVAAWDSKYTYNRPRPSDFDSTLETAIRNPPSPAYPSEYAATAAAASTVLAWLFPEDAEYFENQAEAAVTSRLLAGVEYPSDVEAGLQLGRQVAELAIARGQGDGSDAPWAGTVPTDPAGWTGENPISAQTPHWQTWVLSSPDQFRPSPPPAYDSEQLAAEMEELRIFARTPVSTSKAMYWEFGSGARFNNIVMNDTAGRMILEARLDDNAPRAALVYALVNIAGYDSLIACFEAKYTYWSIRPVQYDPTYTPVFPTPNHPSYPSAHSCNTMAMTTVLAHFFPVNADALISLAHEAGEARIWAGIHFRSDIVAGEALGLAVAGAVLEQGTGENSGLVQR
jgi:membrane-associated phospholipid phosphatase